MRTIRVKTCALVGCGKTFETATKRLYCSPNCSKERIKQQLGELGERRKEAAKSKRIKFAVCSIETCKELYRPKNGKRQKYCGYRCAQVGLQQAIERQRQRRAEKKAATKKSTP